MISKKNIKHQNHSQKISETLNYLINMEKKELCQGTTLQKALHID